MKLVIPLKNDGRYDQLRFALRSITTYHEITDCILVGGKPKWYTGQHIPFRDYGPCRKEENIRDKTIAGAELIQGEFMFANDDHILLSPLRETWNKGLLSNSLANRKGNGSYTRMLKNTFAHYGDVLNVDNHCPMIMTTERVIKTNFQWPMFGIAFKTCYAEENKLQSVFMEDCKVGEMCGGLIITREWFSIRDKFNLADLETFFQNKSIFEV